MREILFRGKRADNAEWVEGDLIQIGGGTMIYYASKFEVEIEPQMDAMDASVKFYPNEITVVIPKTVGQFTGLTDKNGVKIFEGDILGGCNGSINGCEWEEKPFEVKLQLGRFNVPLWAAKEEWDSTHYLTVIGNIHDNPELINK